MTTAIAPAVPITPSKIPLNLDPAYSADAKKPTVGHLGGTYMTKTGSGSPVAVDVDVRFTRVPTQVSASFDDAARGAVQLARTTSLARTTFDDGNQPAVGIIQHGDKFEFGETTAAKWILDGSNMLQDQHLAVAATNPNFPLLALFGQKNWFDLRTAAPGTPVEIAPTAS